MKFLNLIPEDGNIAVIGGGGKTGLIRALAEESQAAGRPVLVTVTTRLGRDDFPALDPIEAAGPFEALVALGRAEQGERVLLTGPFRPDNLTLHKFSGVPLAWFPLMRQFVPTGLTLLVEADGSARLPLKAHRAGEPVLPPLDNFVIGVIGLSALLIPWRKALHRPEAFSALAPLPPEDQPLAPEAVAAFIASAWAPLKPGLIFLNQVDLLVTEPEQHLGRRLADLLSAAGFPVVVGSLKHRSFFRWGS